MKYIKLYEDFSNGISTESEKEDIKEKIRYYKGNTKDYINLLNYYIAQTNNSIKAVKESLALYGFTITKLINLNNNLILFFNNKEEASHCYDYIYETNEIDDFSVIKWKKNMIIIKDFTGINISFNLKNIQIQFKHYIIFLPLVKLKTIKPNKDLSKSDKPNNSI